MTQQIGQIDSNASAVTQVKSHGKTDISGIFSKLLLALGKQVEDGSLKIGKDGLQQNAKHGNVASAKTISGKVVKHGQVQQGILLTNKHEKNGNVHQAHVKRDGFDANGSDIITSIANAHLVENKTQIGKHGATLLNHKNSDTDLLSSDQDDGKANGFTKGHGKHGKAGLANRAQLAGEAGRTAIEHAVNQKMQQAMEKSGTDKAQIRAAHQNISLNHAKAVNAATAQAKAEALQQAAPQTIIAENTPSGVLARENQQQNRISIQNTVGDDAHPDAMRDAGVSNLNQAKQHRAANRGKIKLSAAKMHQATGKNENKGTPSVSSTADQLQARSMQNMTSASLQHPSLQAATSGSTDLSSMASMMADDSLASPDAFAQTLSNGNGTTAVSAHQITTSGTAATTSSHTTSSSAGTSLGPWTAMAAMREIAAQASQGRSSIELQLSPANLGKMRVVLESGADKQIQIHIHVDETVSRQVIQQHLPDLRQALEQQGLNPGQFSMSSGQQNREEGQRQFFGEASSSSAQVADVASTHVADIATDDDTSSRLNIRI